MTPERHARISELFLAALERPEEARGAFLAEACGSDIELRGEVEALLEHDRGAAALDRPVVGAQVRGALRDAETAAIPDRIGPFQILGILGQGGMGTVYRARQTHPDRDVALKVLSGGAFSNAMLRRFEFEQLVLGRLQHPGIAQIYDAGIAEDGGRRVPYFAMELIDGLPLTEFADRRRLDRNARLSLLLKVCDAVRHAHQKGIIHRDLKPGNVLVASEPGTSAQPKILDFGIARATDSEPRTTTTLTVAGQLVGTLPYMSPEQLAGEPDEVDTRSDIYALGVIAFELLTGRLPHDVRDRPLSDAVVQLREREPARLGTIDRSLRGDLETVVAKALEQDRDRRYASASDFAGDIERFLRDEPILARPPSVGYQLRKFARRNRVLVGGTLVAAFLLVAGLAGTAWGLFRAREQRDAAIAAKLEVQRESAKVQAVNEFLERMLESANPLGEAGHGGRDVTVLEMLDRESGAVERSFAGQPALEAAVRTTVGVAYANLARLEDAERHLRVAMQLHRTVYGEESAQYARSLREVAGVRARRGEADEAIGMLRRSLEIEQGVDARPHLERALAHGRLGWALLSAGQLDEAESELQGMLSALDELPDDVRTHRAAALNNLARIARMRGDRDQAETLYREADGLFRALYGDRHASVGMTQNNLAKVLLERGAQDAAVEAYREALAVFQTTLGPGHPMVGDVLNNQSQVELDRGNLTESVRLGRAAADVHRLAYGADHIDYALTVNNLGTVLKKSGDYASARACFEEAAAIRRGKLGESHWRTRFSEALAADCTGRLGAPETAEPILLQTFEEFRQTYPPTDERVRAMARLLADHYARRGRPDDAARYAAIAEPAPK